MAEKEYIERGAVISCILDVNNNLAGVVQHINEHVPAADVVAVVRCKDCVHYKQNQYSTDEYMMCKNWCDWLPTDPDDFCSYGERKVQV